MEYLNVVRDLSVMVFGLFLLVGVFSAPVTDTFSLSEQHLVDGLEKTAQLLIKLDLGIESESASSPSSWNHLYLGQSSEGAPLTNEKTEDNSIRDQKFLDILQELNQIQERIRESIVKANANRQFRLVLRLRPLLSYVTHIHRNMEMLRTRVVAIATLSNLTVTVTEVLDQFADVMTNSIGSGIVRHPVVVQSSSPAAKTSVAPILAVASSSAKPDLVTEVDAESFFKNIINYQIK